MRRLIASLACGCAMASVAVGGAAPADFGHIDVRPEARSKQLGDFEVTSLHDGDVVRANAGKTFGMDVGPSAVDEVLRAAGAPPGRIAMSHSALLVRAGGRVVLIDTGEGPSADGALIPSLALAGVGPRQVTDVLITHGDMDHVGGLIDRDGRSAFPNATIQMSAATWAFLRDDGKTKTEIVQGRPVVLEARAVVAAIQAQVRTFDPGAVVIPGITALAIEGHSPGHVGYEIASRGDRLIDIGDAAHSAIVSLAKPDWRNGVDGNPSLAAATRRAILERLSISGELVFSPHFPFPGLGRIRKAGDGYAWAPEAVVR